MNSEPSTLFRLGFATGAGAAIAPNIASIVKMVRRTALAPAIGATAPAP